MLCYIAKWRLQFPAFRTKWFQVQFKPSNWSEQAGWNDIPFLHYQGIPAAALHIHLLRNLAAKDILPQVGFPPPPTGLVFP